MKKRILALLAACALMLSATGCNNGNDSSPQGTSATTPEVTEPAYAPPEPVEVTLLPENIPADNYGNYYEIFVYSFKDSDGDGCGDFNGITEKLDYIRSMGYTGIWLMPICEGYSYHKYDVLDYYDVDPQFGTMADFEKLVSEAHKRGIKIITDLVVNHTSSEHVWFKSAIQSAWDKDENGKYYDFYNFSDTAKDGYSFYDGVYYESRFVYSMPDLNLDSENVRNEIDSIIRFWTEKGVDGFRLDACTSFYTGDDEKSAAFCDWLTQTAKKYNEDAFVVGEVWASEAVISKYYTASPDSSFFAFPLSQQEGQINMTFNNSNPAGFCWQYMNSTYKTANEGASIPAPFLGNHDTGRIAGAAGRNPDKVKFAYGLLSLLNGATFTYYGDEIGMIGSGVDPNKRIAMRWDNSGEGLTVSPPDTTSTQYEFDGVAEQLADESSILNYYKRCNNIRNAYPEIARGVPRFTPYSGDKAILIVKKAWNDSAVTIIANISAEDKTVSGKYGTMSAELAANGNVTQNGEELIMPAYSFAVMQ